MKKLLTSIYSGTGDVRHENQDSVLSRTGKFGKRTVGLFIVADGCGGMANGRQISNLVTSYFNMVWHKQLPELLSNKHVKPCDVEKMLDDTLEQINHDAIAYCSSIGSKGGSTVSLMLIIGTRYYIRNIGDSRIYRIRYGIKQLTEDQTLVAEMVRNGELTAKEARNHSQKNVLSMCIGYFKNLLIFKGKGLIHRCDNYLVCCDGFYNCFESRDIKRMIRHQKSKDFSYAAERMRNMIPRGHAKDNVSVILVRCKGCYW